MKTKSIVMAILIAFSGVLAQAKAKDTTKSMPKGDSIYQLKSSWTRQDGKKVPLSSLKGSYVVLAMIYTSCEGACPLLVKDLKKIERAIPAKQKARVRFALVSFDSKRDTVAKLKKYASAHDLDEAHWSLYRGSGASVRELAMVLGLKYKEDADGDFEHSNLITLLDPDGRISVQLSGLKQDPTPLLDAITLDEKPE